MANFSDIVFNLMPQGLAALQSEDAPLSSPLKSVLTMVDGVCPVAQYVPFLRAFTPLEKKFQILESMGYLQRIGAVSSEAVTRFEQSVTMGIHTAALPHIDSETKESGFSALE